MFRHTPLSTSLRGAVLECELAVQYKGSFMAGSLGLLAHRGYDPSNHGNAIDKAWNSVISTLPYMTQGLDSDAIARHKAEKLVDRYKEIKANLNPMDEDG